MIGPQLHCGKNIPRANISRRVSELLASHSLLSQHLLLGLLAKITLLYRFVRIDDALRVAFVSDTQSWSAGRIPLSVQQGLV